VLCLGKDLYTLSDLRVPLEEYKVNYTFLKKNFRNSKLLRCDWEDNFVSRTVPLFNSPRKHVS
jgi:hypothetical protein